MDPRTSSTGPTGPPSTEEVLLTAPPGPHATPLLSAFAEIEQERLQEFQQMHDLFVDAAPAAAPGALGPAQGGSAAER